jgi:hypothetical protein
MLTDFLYAASKPGFREHLDAGPRFPFVYSHEHLHHVLGMLHNDVVQGTYRAYDLDERVCDLADGMIRSQWGKPLPYTDFDTEAATVFGLRIQGHSVTFAAVPMSDLGQGLVLIAHSPTGDRKAIAARQITDGKLSLVYADERGGVPRLTSLTALCGVALQLIDGRHVSTQPRTAKHRERINGKLHKGRSLFSFAYIDVSRDKHASNTVAHNSGSRDGVRFHRVRKHLRLTNGKVVAVKAHFRGKGKPQSIAVTKVTASQHKPKQ